MGKKKLSSYFFYSSLKVSFQYCYTTNTVFNLKLNFKLKVDPKTCTSKNLEDFQKTWKKFLKTSGHRGNRSL